MKTQRGSDTHMQVGDEAFSANFVALLALLQYLRRRRLGGLVVNDLPSM